MAVRALVRGVGDIGSAIAHRLFLAGRAVAVHDGEQPTTTRRGMAFADSVFDTSLGMMLTVCMCSPAATAEQVPDSAARGADTAAPTRHIETVPGMPPVVDPNNLYSETRTEKVSAVMADALPRVYVPNLQSNDVSVIDPATFKVVDRLPVGRNPQHVVPSYDLKALWVTNNAEGRPDGSLYSWFTEGFDTPDLKDARDLLDELT